ncbi:hypothetical protein Vadar_034252 [Vaccinium darrowii]|uniref:Uncharacterized protein n=1 Tax=Vaccinium darrowii TaxID=229202 RepID=A0ACB7X6A8_9ERIC|nr:hypothetical protein Vadar_034252 [Vaccinium darrowii]
MEMVAGRRRFPGWTNVAFFSRSFSFYFTQQEEQHPLSHYHTIYGFLLQNLTSFLKQKYQGLDSTPFETHPKTMFICIASFLLYLLAYLIHSHTTPAYANVVLRGEVVLGSLSLVSLASVISPEPIRPVLFLLFPAGLMVNFRLVQVLWNYIQGRMRGNLVHDLNTQQRRIGGPLIDPRSSVAHGYVRREGVLPVTRSMIFRDRGFRVLEKQITSPRTRKLVISNQSPQVAAIYLFLSSFSHLSSRLSYVC